MNTNTGTPAVPDIPQENRDGETGYWPAADFAAKRAAAIMAPPAHTQPDRRTSRHTERMFWCSLSERLSALLDEAGTQGRTHATIRLDDTSPVLGEVGNNCGISLHAWPANMRLLVWGHKVVELVITEDGQPQETVVFGTPEYGTDAEVPIPPGCAKEITVAFGEERWTYTVHRDPKEVTSPWRLSCTDDSFLNRSRNFRTERQATDGARARTLRQQPLTLDQARGGVTVTERTITWEGGGDE
jgi:hypothetical protein